MDDSQLGQRRPSPALLGLIGLLLGLVIFASLFASDRTPDPLRRGARAPSFTLPAIGGGGSVSLADARGRTLLINFWATWCPPCEAEMPAMERLYRGLRAEGFELFAVSVDAQASVVEEFRARHALTFPILHDPERRVANAYQAFKFPESVLVDRDGTVLARFIGEKDWDSPTYVAQIRRALHREGAR